MFVNDTDINVNEHYEVGADDKVLYEVNKATLLMPTKVLQRGVRVGTMFVSLITTPLQNPPLLHKNRVVPQWFLTMIQNPHLSAWKQAHYTVLGTK